METVYNDKSKVKLVRDWIHDAAKDGWKLEPLRHGDALFKSCKMSKDGFIVHAEASEAPDLSPIKTPSRASLHIWDPEGMGFEPPLEYSMEAIIKASRTCPECGKQDVETVRVAFANKACRDCAPALTEKLCYPGWCD